MSELHEGNVEHGVAAGTGAAPPSFLGRVTQTDLQCDSTRLVKRLRGRRAELEEAIIAGVRAAVPDLIADQNAELAEGLPEAVTELVRYSLAAIEDGKLPSASAPAAALEQARRAANSGVTIDKVLRRYVAGSRVLQRLVSAEIAGLAMPQARRITLQHSVSEVQGSLLDRLLAEITGEYHHELEGRIGHGLLSVSAGENILSPLDRGRVDGAELRRALRAYFDSGFNAAAAARASHYGERNFRRKLKMIEDRLGYSVRAHYVELDAALRLEELRASGSEPE